MPPVPDPLRARLGLVPGQDDEGATVDDLPPASRMPRLHCPPFARPDPLDAFVRQHRRAVYALAVRLTGEHAAADDLVQETFVRAWQALDRGDRPERPEAWLRRIAVRIYLNRQRGGFARRVVRWCDEALHGVPDPAPSDAEPTFEAALARALARLSERERAAFVLRHIDDRSTRETADALGVTDGTVKTLLSRAVAKMQVALQPYA